MKKTSQKKNKITLQRGYTLLFAILTASLVLGVAAYIVGIARKQYIISATSRDSAVAFYMADTGVECAVQADLGNAATTSPLSFACGGTVTTSTNFAATDLDDTKKTDLGFSTSYPVVQAPPPLAGGDPYIQFALKDANTAVTVGCLRMKIWSGRSVSGSQRTVVESRGYNQCDPGNSGPALSPRTVERAIRLTL